MILQEVWLKLKAWESLPISLLGRTSQIYSNLIRVSLPVMESLRAGDIPELDCDDWDDIWDLPFLSLVFLRVKLNQFKLVHGAYFTPYRLYKINHSTPPEYWQCGGFPETLLISYGPA